MDPYRRVRCFLRDCNVEYLMNIFVRNKIDDSIACHCDPELLKSFGLTKGDIIKWFIEFGKSSRDYSAADCLPNYKERASELKAKLRRSSTGDKDSLQRNITQKIYIDLTIGVKCLQKGRYVLKMNRNWITNFHREATYEEIHEACRHFYGIDAKLETYLGKFNGENLCDIFINLGIYHKANAMKRHKLHVYIFVPNLLDFDIKTNKTSSHDLGEASQTNSYPHDLNYFSICDASTGADVICTESIKLTFSETTGLSRSVIAHTCRPTLELANTYESYINFKQEFEPQLRDQSWEMDMP